jgi:hypothetical protein
MKMSWAIGAAAVLLVAAGSLSQALSAQEESVRFPQKLVQRVCPQVISCGTKDGKRKEYPNPCAAQDDGATDIKPKTGATCEASQ